MRWFPAYVALGSNLDEPVRQVTEAFARLAALSDTRLIARSRLYRARPMGPQDQPEFINAAAGLLTQLHAEELLARLKAIEQSMGRQPPAVRWGPRVIDLDLLVHSQRTTGDGVPGADARRELLLPHPGIHERNFVLYPLAEIAPELYIPGRGYVVELARRVGSDGLQPL
jgi:2-amino-4-hydroxy-6-hydroxymethyldihydropteridine diphosphokinase